jgi:hypothetical protein
MHLEAIALTKFLQQLSRPKNGRGSRVKSTMAAMKLRGPQFFPGSFLKELKGRELGLVTFKMSVRLG